jgi:hypothetical protein
MSRSERIAQQLGMSHGAAANRLRKKILFSLLIRLKEDVCFKCGKKIETEEQLSIEHKQPWENRNPMLFWDLQNIAFSHLSCNQPHDRKWTSPNPRKTGPEGTAWCRTHKKFLPEVEFSKHVQTWNGIRRDCRECEKKYKDFHRYRKISEDSADGQQAVSNTVPSSNG